MAKLVQKSGYIKSGKAGGYMRYIATREGVEKLAGNGAVTKGQRELIQELLHDFPDAVELFEYEDYCKTTTLGTASAFISMALDANLHEIDSESGYMQYIATRPRVQKRGTHGLFSSATAVDLASAISELEAHEGMCGPSSTLCVVRMLIVWNTTTPMRGARSSWRTHRRWQSQ